VIIVSYCGTHRANSQPFGDWKAEKTERTKGREGYRKTEFGQDAAISVEEEAIFVQSYKSRARNHDLEHTLDACSPGYHCVQDCKFGRNPTICPREEAISVSSQKCPDHMTLTLSTPWMHAHLETIMCKFDHNRAICVVVQAICAKSLQMDGQTDDGHRSIVLAH